MQDSDRRRSWDDAMVQRCVALRQAGRTYEAVAQEMGISVGAVAGCIRRLRCKDPTVDLTVTRQGKLAVPCQGNLSGRRRKGRPPASPSGSPDPSSPRNAPRAGLVVSAAVADLLRQLVIAGTEMKQARFGPGERARTIAFQKAAEALVDRLSPIPKSKPKEVVR